MSLQSAISSKSQSHPYYALLISAILSGLLLSATIPVGGIPWLMFVALVPLLWAEDVMHRHRGNYFRGAFFLLTMTAFVIYGTAGSWWLKNAAMVGAISAVMVNSLLMALAMVLFHRGRRHFKSYNTGYYLLVCYWLAFEHLHHNWDLNYPWYSLGNVFSAWPSWVQWYEYTGVGGGSLWLLVTNIMVYLLIRPRLIRGSEPFTQRGKTWLVAVLIGWILIPATISHIRYYTWKPTGEPLEVVLVQPNTDPYHEQYTIGPLAAINNFLTLAAPHISSKTHFVVGPESMIQENLWERHFDESPSIDSLRSFVKRHPHLTLIAGASSFRMFYADEEPEISAREMDPHFQQWYANYFGVDTALTTKYYNAYNLGMGIDTTGVTGLTHKSKLVAGVERLPFKKYLAPLVGDMAIDLGGTVGTLGVDADRSVLTHTHTGTKYGIAICYESVFGEFFGAFVRNGAQYMFIITNDGWWGNTPGHRQHNAFASLRAIETRREIARSANTGITCFINGRGDILQPTPYWVPDAIKGTIHTNNKITFYVRYGDYIGRMAVVFTVLMLLIVLSYTIVPKKLRKR
jgi:apolipoprotein N-acyltransferase